MTLFEADKTEKESMRWNERMVELLPTSNGVSFDNIKDSMPFESEQQLLNEVLFDPECLSSINIDKDRASNAFHYSLNEDVDDGMDIKSNVSAELIIKNITSLNPDGILLSEIKRYFPLQRLELNAYNSLIDWLQHRFSAYIQFGNNAFITWKNTDQLNAMMQSLNLSEMPHNVECLINTLLID